MSLAETPVSSRSGGVRQQGADKENLRAAGLRRVAAVELGIRRVRNGTGFRYLAADGTPIRDRVTIRRLKALAVPPAYQEVRLAENPRAHLQAIGRDAAGRLQYRYHPNWEQVREQRKARQLVDLIASLSCIRRRVTRLLAGSEPTRDFAIAAVIELISQTAIRPGSESYARQYGTRGAATLLKSNVSTKRNAVTLRFRAKRGQPVHLTFDSRQYAKAVTVLRALPGRRLFQYRAEDGEVCTLRRRQVNAFLRECAGRRVTLKDFRTLIASTLVLDRLARMPPATSQRARRRQIIEAVRPAAIDLANTPAVCRRSYVHETIFTAFENGELMRFAEAIKVCRTAAARERVLAQIVSGHA